MMKKVLPGIIFFILVVSNVSVSAEELEPESIIRTWEIPVGYPADMEFVASAGLALNTMLTDAWFKGIGRNMKDPFREILGTTWQIWWTFMTTIWPHEFGHWVRAREIGGEFVFESFGIPWPDARMDLPEDCDLLSETLTSVGGFEINVLMRRAVVQDFYREGYAFFDQLTHSFIQGIYFPAYAFIVAPAIAGGIDPRDPETWINTMGDPVESAQLVYRNYTKRPSLTDAQTVDPQLVSWYWEYTLLGLAWLLADPLFYTSLKAFSSDVDNLYGKIDAPMIDFGRFRWMAGTLFNPGPLGYELYLYSHLLLDNRYYGLYLKYGRPFLNLGIGLQVPEILSAPGIRAGFSIDYWYEEPLGHGMKAGFTGEVDVSPRLSLGIDGGWKTRGYLLGYPLDEGLFVRGNLLLRSPVH
ncbi:MAG: hypothetical protein JW760_15095 [Spirochaetales bacterium]|nr:hypothetical protein [Spirochaetales bacterium]